MKLRNAIIRQRAFDPTTCSDGRRAINLSGDEQSNLDQAGNEYELAGKR
jgi:hypothetical protein